MTKEQKNDFTLRISQANSTELIIILYDMTICYLEDAIKNKGSEEFGRNARNAMYCIEEMQNNLHYEYELAKVLKQIYLYMKKQIRTAIISKETDNLVEVKGKLTSLKSSYEKIKNEDKSAPIMTNTQSVIIGMTYSREKLLNSLTTVVPSRGFIV